MKKSLSPKACASVYKNKYSNIFEYLSKYLYFKSNTFSY